MCVCEHELIRVALAQCCVQQAFMGDAPWPGSECSDSPSDSHSPHLWKTLPPSPCDEHGCRSSSQDTQTVRRAQDTSGPGFWGRKGLRILTWATRISSTLKMPPCSAEVQTWGAPGFLGSLWGLQWKQAPQEGAKAGRARGACEVTQAFCRHGTVHGGPLAARQVGGRDPMGPPGPASSLSMPLVVTPGPHRCPLPPSKPTPGPRR